jgi:hypothetical protein
MIEVFVGLIAVLPALLGYLNSRKRQLATIETEISVFNALPKGDKTSRDAMRAEIAESLAHYRSRRTRQVEMLLTFGWTVAWLLMILGYDLYKGSLTDPQTLTSLRQTAGWFLFVLGVGLFLFNMVVACVKGYVAIRLWLLRRQTKKLKKRVEEQEAQIQKMEERIAALEVETAESKKTVASWVADVIAAEEEAIEAGEAPKPRPPLLAEVFVAYEAKGSLDDYEPSPELIATVKAAETPAAVEAT